MKTLLNIFAIALLIAGIPESRADTAASAKEPQSATLLWNQIARDTLARTKSTQHQAMRLLTHVSLAQYAALASAPSESSADAIATASKEVIAALVPSQAEYAAERHRERQARDDEHGLRAAERALAAAASDGFAAPWNGEVPQTEHAWRSLAEPPAPPAYPAIGGMRTFFIESGDAVRPAPPPQIGDARFLADLAEVRRYTESPTEDATRIAKFYDMTTGTMAAGYWNERAADMIRASNASELRAATLLATMNAAIMDAIVACHDAKYTYWVPRPSQVDPAITPVIGVPNHPSYPSNHACVSTAAGLVLANFFPQARTSLEQSAAEAGLSRIYAGIHFRFDVQGGEEIGRQVAAAAIARHPQVLAQWSSSEGGRSAARVPDELVPPSDESFTWVVPAKGVQIYECRESDNGHGQYEWAFVAPQAELLDTRGNGIGRHYGGPHWEAYDGSKVVGTLKARADAPVANAIPWLLLAAKSVGNGGVFSKVSSIQRVATSGGVAPAAGCSHTMAGTSARIAYTADYYFFARE